MVKLTVSNSLQKLWAILSPRERRNAFLVISIAFFAAIFEVVGIVSILPFLKVMANPNFIQENEYLRLLFYECNFTSNKNFLIFLASLTFIIVLIAGVVRATSYYVLTRFAQMRRHSIGLKLLQSYMQQPYEFFLNRHSGELAKSILSETEFITTSFLNPLVIILSHSLIFITVVLLLLLLEPLIVIGTAILFSMIYVVIFSKLSGRIGLMGKERVRCNQARFEAVTEAIGGIKDYKLLRKEQIALHRFEGPSRDIAKSMTNIMAISQLPRYGIEIVAFGGMLLVAILLITRQSYGSDNFLEHVIPMLGVFAFAGYRMLPAIQGIYQSMAQYRFGTEAVEQVYTDIMRANSLPPLTSDEVHPLTFQNTVRLCNVSYRYPGADNYSLNELDITFRKGQLIGIVGSTGAGKTTFVDILLGLLRPQKGTIQVDDISIQDDNLPRWQKNIGYVPQDIFLTDNTIRENIAFGVPESEIDDAKVAQAAKMARIDEFVSNNLPDGYFTIVGERGVRLSGGQKQRIGIARALYYNPDVIVFDEATSALDNLTEKEVMEAINQLTGAKTIILIAHRLSTIEKCDVIFVLKDGKVVSQGTYDELASQDSVFQGFL